MKVWLLWSFHSSFSFICKWLWKVNRKTIPLQWEILLGQKFPLNCEIQPFFIAKEVCWEIPVPACCCSKYYVIQSELKNLWMWKPISMKPKRMQKLLALHDTCWGWQLGKQAFALDQWNSSKRKADLFECWLFMSNDAIFLCEQWKSTCYWQKQEISSMALVLLPVQYLRKKTQNKKLNGLHYFWQQSILCFSIQMNWKHWNQTFSILKMCFQTLLRKMRQKYCNEANGDKCWLKCSAFQFVHPLNETSCLRHSQSQIERICQKLKDFLSGSNHNIQNKTWANEKSCYNGLFFKLCVKFFWMELNDICCSTSARVTIKEVISKEMKTWKLNGMLFQMVAPVHHDPQMWKFKTKSLVLTPSQKKIHSWHSENMFKETQFFGICSWNHQCKQQFLFLLTEHRTDCVNECTFCLWSTKSLMENPRKSPKNEDTWAKAVHEMHFFNWLSAESPIDMNSKHTEPMETNWKHTQNCHWLIVFDWKDGWFCNQIWSQVPNPFATYVTSWVWDFDHFCKQFTERTVL